MIPVHNYGRTKIPFLWKFAGLRTNAAGARFVASLTSPAARRAAILVGGGLLATLLLGFSHESHDASVAVTTLPAVTRVRASSQTLIDRDTRILTTTAANRLDAVLDPLFMDFHDRVPAFGEWAFGWRTGYRLLREGMLTAIALPFTESPELERINSVWDELIVNKFNELVLQPSGGIAALRSAHENWRADMRLTVDSIVTDTLRTVALLHGQTFSLPFDEADTAPEERPANEFFPTEQGVMLAEVSAVASPIKVRAARPLLARLTIRPPVAAAVTAAGEAIGNQAETLLGSVSNLAAVIVAFLSIDYMLSQTDAGIHRPSMEADVHRVLENEHRRLRTTWLAEQQAEIDDRLARIRPLLNIGDASSP